MYKFETQEVEEPGFDRTDRFTDYLQVVFYFTDYIPIRTSEVVSMCSYRQFVYTYQGHRGNIQRKIKIILGGVVVVSPSRSCFPHGGWHQHIFADGKKNRLKNQY